MSKDILDHIKTVGDLAHFLYAAGEDAVCEYLDIINSEAKADSERAAAENAALLERCERLEAATAFEVMPQVFRNGRAYGEITIERRKQLGGETKWAVILRNAFVLNTDMQWEYEPIPSSRTDEFIASTRFDLDTAWRMAEEAAKKELEHAAALDGAK